MAINERNWKVNQIDKQIKEPTLESYVVLSWVKQR